MNAPQPISVREQILDEKGHSSGSLALEGAQGGVFSGIFANLNWVVETPIAKYVFFGAATFLSLLKTSHNAISYWRRKNRTVGKGVLLAINIASLIAEGLAVAAAFTGAILAAASVPLVFVAMLGANFLSNVGQMFYHGFKWAMSVSGSEAGLKHRARFWGHLRGSVLLAVSGTVIGLLLLTPAFYLAVLTAGVVLAVKIAGATILGLNAAAIFYSIPIINRILSPIVKPVARFIFSPAVKVVKGISNAITHGMRAIFGMGRQRAIVRPEAEGLLHQEFSSKPQSEAFKNDPVLLNKYKHAERFKSLKDDDIDDLLRKLEAVQGGENAGPKMLIDDLIKQSQEALEKDLSVGRNNLFNLEYTKRQDKRYVLRNLNKLVNKEEVIVYEKSETKRINNVQELIDHLKVEGKFQNAISSAFATDVNQGKMQKLLVLTDHYLSNDRLHPAPIDRGAPVPTPVKERKSRCVGGCTIL